MRYKLIHAKLKRKGLWYGKVLLEVMSNNAKSKDNTIIMWHTVSRDSSVGIATGYGLDDREVGVKSR
jgi:hypothetical protein